MGHIGADRNWKGIGISLLVIVVVLSFIGLSIVLLSRGETPKSSCRPSIRSDEDQSDILLNVEHFHFVTTLNNFNKIVAVLAFSGVLLILAVIYSASMTVLPLVFYSF